MQSGRISSCVLYARINIRPLLDIYCPFLYVSVLLDFTYLILDLYAKNSRHWQAHERLERCNFS